MQESIDCSFFETLFVVRQYIDPETPARPQAGIREDHAFPACPKEDRHAEEFRHPYMRLKRAVQLICLPFFVLIPKQVRDDRIFSKFRLSLPPKNGGQAVHRLFQRARLTKHYASPQMILQ
jgi:hypothetical protein